MKKLKVLFIVGFLVLFANTAFSGNATYEKARHRLPPIIYSIDIPEVVKPNNDYTFKWTVMGYHDTYNIVINVYDEDGNKLDTDTVSPHSIESGQYAWGNVNSFKFFYETTMNFNFSGSQELTIRFFASPVDDPIDNTYLSCIVPGGLGYEPGDTTGRKIKIFGSDTPNERLWSVLLQKARVGDILLFAPQAGCEDGNCLGNSTFNFMGLNIPYGYYRHAALIYRKDFDSIQLLHARGPGNGVGSEESKDTITYSILSDGPWERVALLRVDNVSNLWAKKIVNDAYKKFRNTGYGLVWGTYCSELVLNAYKPLVDLSDGGTTFGVYTPDSIINSGNIKVISVVDFSYVPF